MLLFTAASLAPAENYAVLIAGEEPDSPNYCPEFYYDIFLVWEMLWQHGWSDENIFVLFGLGVGINNPPARYDPSQYNIFPWYIESIVDDAASLQDVVDIFNYLDNIMTENDFLFV